MNVILNANQGWRGADYELEAGVIDDTARHVFVAGQCHSLALALHEATGWDMVGIQSPWDDAPGHVAVRTPKGRILDIEGTWTDEDWSDRWYGDDVVDVDPADAYAAFDRQYRPPEVDKARYWVKPVLREYVPTSQWLHLVK